MGDQGLLIPAGVAKFSSDKVYRYELTRDLYPPEGTPLRTILWVMLNPSTADADVDDPTIRRVLQFSRRERPRFSRVAVVNLFAYRATDPNQLKLVTDPVGSRNDEAIRRWVERADLIVGAWGQVKTLRSTVMVKLFDTDHRVDVLTAAAWDRPEPKPIWCLGMNKDGSPRHPLYVRGDRRFVPWLLGDG